MCGCAPALDAGKIVQKKLTKINLLKEGRLINLLSIRQVGHCCGFQFLGIILRFNFKEFSAFAFDKED